MSSRYRQSRECGNQARFKALVHYICDAFSETPSQLGKVKLQKILWNTDRTAYLKYGASISGVPYVKMPEGPATPLLDQALSALEADGMIKVRTTTNGPFRQFMFLSLEEASDALFSKEEVRIIDRWIRYAAGKTARQLSKESHDLTWEVYDLGEEIDMTSALLPTLQAIDPLALEHSLRRFQQDAAADEG